MLTFILTGGFFVVSIPSWIAWLRWLSYIFYSLGLLLYIQFEGQTIFRWWVNSAGRAGAGGPALNHLHAHHAPLLPLAQHRSRGGRRLHAQQPL